ncbi:MAG TPA: hypothetical protein VGP07_12980 [Polyangia bacterium]|jgi:predicted anti-sigma-YlaC factor YlaD
MADNLCERARRHFSDHADGQPLPVSSRLLVGLHLRICPLCRRVKASLDTTRRALSELRDSDPDVDRG